MSFESPLLAKKVIVEIIRQSGGSLTGKTRIYKAFYFAHLFYADEAPDFLTDWPIVHMPNGPGIDDGEELLATLVHAGYLEVESLREGPYTTTRYSLTQKELPGGQLSSIAVEAIRAAAAFVSQRNASQLSDLTHEHSRSWNATRDGQPLNVYVDTIPEGEYENRKRSLERIRAELASARLECDPASETVKS